MGQLTTYERHRLISRLVDEFERRGWRDDGHAALAIVRAIETHGRRSEGLDLAVAVGRRFRILNEATPGDLESVVQAAMR